MNMIIWSAETIDNLNYYQTQGQMHPFTCPQNGDKDTPHGTTDLVATRRGWICPYCDYTQDWAHPFMKEWKKFVAETLGGKDHA